MKTISLDHPVRVYFKDGECYHDSAAIMIANGFPSFIRGRNPDVIYPWENIKHVIRVADEPVDDPDLTECLRASVAAIADERNGAKQETHRLRAEVERLQAENDHLKALHTEKRVALRDALGLTYDNHDHAGLCAEVKRIRAEWDHLSRYNSPEKLARLEMRSQHDRDMLAKALGVDARDVDHGDLCARAKSMQADLASVAEQRDVLKRQLEELRVDVREGGNLNQTKRQRFIGGRWIDVNLQSEIAAPDPDHRDSYRGTALRAGAKDCTLFVGPKPSDLTFVVEMREGCKVFDVVAALEHEHGLQPEAYRIREVRAPMP